MILYRLSKGAYADDLSGSGARLYGGRWNSKGKPTIYLASSQALALVEVLVHLPAILKPDDYFLVEIEVPDAGIQQVNASDLPDGWRAIQPPALLKRIGDQFLTENQFLLLKVPSVIVPDEYNYLLNVHHPAMDRVKVVKKELFYFDKRLYVTQATLQG